MSDADKPRVPLAIICGVFCLIVGLAQFLYSFLAFASVIFVDLLGIGLTIASSAIAAVPDKPIEIPYARALAKTIAVTGMVFSVATFVSGCRCFYRRHVSRIDLIACTGICTFLAVLHFMNSLSFQGSVYVAVVVLLLAMLLVDRGIVRFLTKKKSPDQRLNTSGGLATNDDSSEVNNASHS